MKKLIDGRHASFKNAFNGLSWAISTQPNFIIHLVISAVALSLGIYLKLQYMEWLTISILILLGLIIEMINTAIEATTDAITREWREDIKIAKDVSAASMLLFAVGAGLISCAIYVPKLLTLFNK